MMNSRTITIGVIVLIVIGLIIWLVSSKNATSTPQDQQQTAQQDQTGAKVQAQDVKVGTGAVAAPGSVVSVLYVGKLADGTVFDSSAAHGNQPLVFQLGAQGLIPGFQIGINGMKVGGERVMAIPPELGYGTQEVKDPTTGKVVIPANSTIQFDVQLVKVQTLEEALADQKTAQAAATSTQKAPATSTKK